MNSGQLVPEEKPKPVVLPANVLVGEETEHDKMLKQLQGYEQQLQAYEQRLLKLTEDVESSSKKATEATDDATDAVNKSDKTNELVVLGFKVLLFMVAGMVIAVVALFSAFVIYMKQSSDSDSSTSKLLQAIGTQKPTTVQVVEPTPTTTSPSH